MLIKPADSREKDIAILEQIAARPAADKALKERVTKEIKTIYAGMKGEREAAYEIDFYMRDSEDYAVLHDLRLEYKGRVAQIDHLVIDRDLRFWVLESKHFAEGVAVNADGEFTAFYRGRPQGIASPVEQNKRHMEVLDDVLRRGGEVDMPKFLFMTVLPKFRNVVLVSKRARVQRAKDWQEKNTWIIKADQFWTLVKAERAKDESNLWAWPSQRLEQVATQLAQCHTPIDIDWEARFPVTEDSQQPKEQTAQKKAPNKAPGSCNRCGKTLTTKEIYFCRFNKAQFGGGSYCKGCQPKFQQEYNDSPLALGSPTFKDSAATEKEQAVPSSNACERCGDPIPARVARYCKSNAERFKGHLFCRPCQEKV